MNSRGSYQQIKQQICFEAKPFFVGRQAHTSATPSRWHGTGAIRRPSRSTSATLSTAPRESPLIRNLLRLSRKDWSWNRERIRPCNTQIHDNPRWSEPTGVVFCLHCLPDQLEMGGREINYVRPVFAKQCPRIASFRSL